ncbi:calcium-binding protein, partial [Ideonella azotifigens]
GGNGNDTLDGGIGDDALSGGAGSDTFAFGLGSGKDTVDSYDTSADKNDILKLGPGIGADDVALTREGTTLVVSLKGSADQIRVQNQFNTNAAYAVNSIRFADGTTWSISDIAARAGGATTGNDALVYGGSDDTISALAGNDSVQGGKGNDSIDGGAGNDTFVFSRGDGSDTVYDYDTTAGNADTARWL